MAVTVIVASETTMDILPLNTNTVTTNNSTFPLSPSSPIPAFPEDNSTVAFVSGRGEIEFPVLSQTATVTVVFTVAYIAIFVLSLMNNSAVLTVIRQNPQMRTVTNYFLANLAAADLIVSFTVLPITLLSNILTGELHILSQPFIDRHITSLNLS